MGHARNLAVLARAPEPGRSKTRLIPRLGAEGACDFAKAALVDTLHLMSAVESCHRVLFYTPNDAGLKLQALLHQEKLADEWELQSQPDAPDLGDRLQAALEYIQSGEKSAGDDSAVSSQGVNASVTFIGMDCLDLTTEMVQSSMTRVEQSRSSANMIPANDGGYVLLTLPLACDANRVFSHIAWSTDRTGEMQVQRLRESGLSCELGDVLSDVDEPEDLDRLWATRASWGHRFPRTMQYLGTVMER